MNLYRKIVSKFQPILYPIIKWWYKKPRVINHQGIRLKLYPTVFHPKLYGSTNVFLQFANNLNLKEKSVLELGAGSGFFTFYLAKNHQTIAFASDINPKAIQGLKENSNSLNLNVKVFQSNLFDDIPNKHFDCIFINPPYYQGNAKSPDELAFYAGDELQYFIKLFDQIKSVNYQKCYMILSENAPIASIIKMVVQHDIGNEVVKTTFKKGEKYFIYLFDS